MTGSLESYKVNSIESISRIISSDFISGLEIINSYHINENTLSLTSSKSLLLKQTIYSEITTLIILISYIDA